MVIDFSISCQRQLVHHHERLWNHVVGQLGLQVMAQFGNRRHACRGWDYIGHELLVASCFFANGNDRLSYQIMLFECGSDFPQFDPEAANLHLVIRPTEELDDSIGTVANQVSGLV